MNKIKELSEDEKQVVLELFFCQKYHEKTINPTLVTKKSPKYFEPVYIWSNICLLLLKMRKKIGVFIEENLSV